MTNLGLLYANGWGVRKDDAKARQWYEKAAAAGHTAAMTNLAVLYRRRPRSPEGLQGSAPVV